MVWKKPLWRHLQSGFWRRRRDSNSRAVAGKLISSQPRYDHVDTSPYMLTRFREVNALFNFIRIFIRTQRILKLLVCGKPALLKALCSFAFSKKHNISSAAPSTTRTTLHMSIRKSFPKLLEKNWRKELRNIRFFELREPTETLDFRRTKLTLFRKFSSHVSAELQQKLYNFNNISYF